MSTEEPDSLPPRKERATFGALLRRYRLAAGLSQEALAERAQMSVRGLIYLERGRRQPYPHTVSLLAQALGLSAAEGTNLRALGSHALKGLSQPEEIYQVLHPDLPAAFPPLPSPRAHPCNLPPALTSFIGREREQLEVRALLDAARLVTLTGAGGAGKTRLALAVAGAAVSDYPNGVWLVELAPLAGTAFGGTPLVAQAVIETLGLREEAGQTPRATLLAHLKEKHLLLVLDNCEHLVAACAALAEALLRGCPTVRILATSREGLAVAGERLYRVPSLAAPRLDRLPPPEGLGDYAAVALFVARARERQADFVLSSGNARAVAAVCARLDGMPLAIELAAARVGSLPVEAIAARLDDRFRLLTAGPRTALPRQQTLRAALDWSYDLLGESEQRLLDRLSVFAGGWTLEAAEAVCAGVGVADWEVLDLLGGLVNKSLVVLEEAAGDGAHARYRLLETLRQYARERLVTRGELVDLCRRHAAYFREWAVAASAQLQGPYQVPWLDRLERDYDNLRTALRWAIDQEDTEPAMRLAASLSNLWFFRGHYSEGRTLRAAVLSLPADPHLAALHAELLQGGGMLAIRQGDYSEARAYLNEGLAIARRVGDQRLLAHTLATLGFVARVQDDYAAARPALEESLALARDVADSFILAMGLYHLGLLALEADRDYDTAWRLSEQSLALYRRIGNRRMIGSVLTGIGRVMRARGDVEAARVSLAEALIAFGDVGDEGRIPFVLYTLAALQADTGRLECAVQVAAVASHLDQSLGSRAWPVILRERDEWLEPARRVLGNDAFARAWAEGQAMTREQAITLAL